MPDQDGAQGPGGSVPADELVERVKDAIDSVLQWRESVDGTEEGDWPEKDYEEIALAALTATGLLDAPGEELRAQRRDAFTDCLSDYERLRGYVNRRYGDTLTQREVNAWMADNGYGLFVEGVPEADAWRERFWPMSVPKGEPDGQAE